MVSEIALGPGARVRIWCGDASIPRSEIDGVRLGSIPANRSATVVHGTVGMEAVVARGARSAYGLLVLRFVDAAPEGDRRALRLEVPFSDSGGPWPGSLAAEVDDVRSGLASEYADSVLKALASHARGRFPAGTVTVAGAAHGVAGSSPDFFARIVRALMELQLMERAVPLVEDAIASELRSLLVTGAAA